MEGNYRTERSIGASDRGGSTEDGANFVLLLSDMRAAFGQTYGISVTLPTSYWYLQGFLVGPNG
jgi:chitinase